MKDIMYNDQDYQIVRLIDELKFQLKKYVPYQEIASDLDNALNGVIDKHNLATDQHNFATLPKVKEKVKEYDLCPDCKSVTYCDFCRKCRDCCMCGSMGGKIARR